MLLKGVKIVTIETAEGCCAIPDVSAGQVDSRHPEDSGMLPDS